MYHQPITTQIKNGVIEIPKTFLKHMPEEGECDIEMISDNVMVIVFKKQDDCFSKLESIEHLLELYEDKLLYAKEKYTLLTQLQIEIQELWKLSVGKGKYFEQCVIMMKVALKRVDPKVFNLTHLNLFLDMIRRLQQKQITQNDVQRYDQLFAANQMDVMLKLGEDIAQLYLEER
ncbi:hypothetical protein H8E77_20540 [bacterium]|nr:hypothetical protein [bacterium]